MFDDPYHNPEIFGLRLIGTVEDPDLSYEYDIFAVWKDQDGYLYYQTDSGCSCPSPFEDHTLETLNKVDPGNPDAVVSFIRALDAWNHQWDEPKNSEGVHDLLTKLGMKVL